MGNTCNLLSTITSKSNFNFTYDFYPYQISKMSSPINKVFGNDATPALPEAPKQNNDRRASDASVGSESFFNGRRRSSAAQRFANLEALSPAVRMRRAWLGDNPSMTHMESLVSSVLGGTTSPVDLFNPLPSRSSRRADRHKLLLVQMRDMVTG